jgi:hypothetical protein
MCKACSKSFSTRTLSPTYGQKRSDLNWPIYIYQSSGVSIRRIAKNLGCTYKTAFLKYKWVGKAAKEYCLKQKFSVDTLQFDELLTIEHTKLKPLSVAIAVSDDYKILGVQVGTIPASGKLAAISRNKYGPREDESLQKTKELLTQVSSQLSSPLKSIKSDAKPGYKSIIKEIYKDTPYEQFIAEEHKEKKREQKYLKSQKHIHDPLFAVNHMCARLRDHTKRLARRSWCTTKLKENLELALYIYIARNNGYKFL